MLRQALRVATFWSQAHTEVTVKHAETRGWISTENVLFWYVQLYFFLPVDLL